MNKKNYLLLGAAALAASYTLSSCKEKKDSEEIVVEKIVEKPQTNAIAMPGKTSEGNVNWVNGAQYTYTISQNSDPELAEVENNGETYKDNSATLTIKRTDGTVFYTNTFAKSSFTGLLSKDMIEHGVFLGMAFDHGDADNLYFVVSIGSPDENSEEFTLVQLILNRMGSTSVANYKPDEIPES